MTLESRNLENEAMVLAIEELTGFTPNVRQYDDHTWGATAGKYRSQMWAPSSGHEALRNLLDEILRKLDPPPHAYDWRGLDTAQRLLDRVPEVKAKLAARALGAKS